MTVEDKSAAQEPELAEDLIAMARRGALPGPLRRRLSMCLAASDSLRWLDQVGHDFDQMQTALGSDKSDAESLVALARHRYAKLPSALGVRWSNFRRAALAGIGISFLALGAGAAIRGLAFRATSTVALVAPAASAATTVAQERRIAANNPRLPDKVLTDAAASGATAVARATPRIDATRKVESLPATGESASSTALFSSANAARRRGERRLAMSLYRQLQSSFPASPQTSLSHVLLARLELGQGDPQAALTQFDAYLRQAPDGSLAQEALQGKAQALGALGRNDEEHDVWRELLRRFPTSPYAASARQRLGTNDKPE